MTAHWAALGVAPGSRVFVPLAGKSQDMRWLAESGHRVLGVELSSSGDEDDDRGGGSFTGGYDSPRI